MIIYLDIVLIENIIMNYIILCATGMIMKLEIKQIRIFLASLIGGIYAVISFMSILEAYSSVILKIALSVSMVYLSFYPKNIKLLFKQILIFYLTSFTFGGVAFSLLYFIRPQDIFIKNGLFLGTYPIKIAFLGGIVGFVILNISFKIIKGKISKKDMFCEIEICINNKKKTVKGMIDTGNLLKEPITKAPVIVVESNSLKELLPQDIIENVQPILQGNNTFINKQYDEEGYVSRFRIIPFSSLGKQNGILLGIKSDYIILNNQNKIKDVIIGIYEKSLTKNGSYTALIGLDILERSDKNKHIADVKI